MDYKIIDLKIKEAVDKIVAAVEPEKIILFGSRAWGTPTPESDVDLFVVKDTQEPRFERTKHVRSSIWGLGFPVDLLVYTPSEIARRFSFDDPFFREIFNKGKVVYER